MAHLPIQQNYCNILGLFFVYYSLLWLSRYCCCCCCPANNCSEAHKKPTCIWKCNESGIYHRIARTTLTHYATYGEISPATAIPRLPDYGVWSMRPFLVSRTRHRSMWHDWLKMASDSGKFERFIATTLLRFNEGSTIAAQSPMCHFIFTLWILAPLGAVLCELISNLAPKTLLIHWLHSIVAVFGRECAQGSRWLSLSNGALLTARGRLVVLVPKPSYNFIIITQTHKLESINHQLGIEIIL